MFDCPPASLLNRRIPKSKFLANSHPSTRLRDLLTTQVGTITWLAKLSPESTNLSATSAVAEIEVFHLTLKEKEINPDLLDFLDKTVPHPIFFRIQNKEGECSHSAAFKRPHEVNAGDWVLSSRFSTDFASSPPTFPPLPTALDLDKLYLTLFELLLPLSSRSGESLEALINRNKQHQTLSRQARALENKLNREKQFNRKVVFNQELNALRLEIQQKENS